MSRCEWTEACTFFNDEIGYSPELQADMRAEFCLGDSTHCARLEAIADLPIEEIPDDLIPTDHARLERLIIEFRARDAG